MTTIGPQKKRGKVQLLMLGFLGVFVMGAIVGIPLYNDIVNFKHDIRDAEKRIAGLEVENAEIKNKLYETVDADRLQKSAGDLGLILEKSPGYLEIDSKNLATN